MILALVSIFFAACVGHCLGCDRSTRVATYNIRRFGFEETDMDRLTAIVASTRSDAIAVQEIERVSSLHDLARRLSTGGHEWRVALSECGGRSNMRVGFLYGPPEIIERLTQLKQLADLHPGSLSQRIIYRLGRSTDWEPNNDSIRTA